MADRALSVLLPAAMLVYAGAALLERWWVSAVVAVMAALLMWRRHPRARFTAYIVLSAVALRGAVVRSWWTVGFAVVVLVLMQMPAARRAWPRLVPGARPGRARRAERARVATDARGDDRMPAS
jgi:hypothetical protein